MMSFYISSFNARLDLIGYTLEAGVGLPMMVAMRPFVTPLLRLSAVNILATVRRSFACSPCLQGDLAA